MTLGQQQTGQSWAGIDSALRYGKRTLPGGSSLAKLLKLQPIEGV
jgi:hypothetical protein